IEENGTAKLLGQFAADGKAQAISFDSRVFVARQAKERLEDALGRLDWDSCAIVGDVHRPILWGNSALNPDAAAARGGFCGVGDQVPEDLLAERRVRNHLRVRVVGESLPSKLCSLSRASELAINLPDHGSHRERAVRRET